MDFWRDKYEKLNFIEIYLLFDMFTDMQLTLKKKYAKLWTSMLLTTFESTFFLSDDWLK